MDVGMSPSFIAAHEGRLEVLKTLYVLGADVNAPDNRGASPLYAAACNGYAEVIDFLVLHGGDVNAPNKDGSTPVHVAALQQHNHVLALLFKHCAFMSARDMYGRSPMDIVRQQRCDNTLTARFLQRCIKSASRRGRRKGHDAKWLVQRNPVFLAPKRIPQALHTLVSSVFDMFPTKNNKKKNDNRKTSTSLYIKPGVTVATRTAARGATSVTPPPPPLSVEQMRKTMSSTASKFVASHAIPSLRHGYVNVSKQLLTATAATRLPPPPPSGRQAKETASQYESFHSYIKSPPRPSRPPPQQPKRKPAKLVNNPPPIRPPPVPPPMLDDYMLPTTHALTETGKRRLFINSHIEDDEDCPPITTCLPSRNPPKTPISSQPGSLSNKDTNVTSPLNNNAHGCHVKEKTALMSPIRSQLSVSLQEKLARGC